MSNTELNDGGDANPALGKREQDILYRLDTLENQILLKLGERSNRHYVDWYKRVADTIQLLVVIAGFTLTVLQIGKLQEATDLSAWNSVSAEWLKVDQYFVQNPKLRKYFYDGIPIGRTDPDYEQVEAVANYVLNFLDYAVSTSDHIVSRYPSARTFIHPDEWKAYVRQTYFRSPAVCILLDKLAAGYNKETRKPGNETCPKP